MALGLINQNMLTRCWQCQGGFCCSGILTLVSWACRKGLGVAVNHKLCLSGDSWTLCRVASGVACSLSLLVFPLKDGSHSSQQLWGGGRNRSQLGMLGLDTCSAFSGLP